MASRFYLYGASPSELAQQQAGYESRFTNVAEGNRGAAMDANRFNIQAQIEAQRADEAARQNDAQRRMQAFAIQSRDAEQAATRSENQRRYDFGQGIEMEERNRIRDFQTRFEIPQNQASLEKARLTNELLKVAPQQERNNRLASFQNDFSVPRDISNFNPDMIAESYGLPKETVIPVLESSYKNFAIDNAAKLNAMMNSSLAALEKARSQDGAPYTADDKDKLMLKDRIEAQFGKIHPEVKFNSERGFWQVGQPQAAAQPAATESNRAVKKYVLVNGQLQLQQ